MDTTIYNLGQKVYLTLNGVYNDVTGDERTSFIDEIIDWANQYLEELELEADWSWLRDNGRLLGTVAAADDTFALPTDVLRPIYDWQRAITMTRTDGQIVTWSIVKPNLLYNPAEGGVQQNRVAVVSRTLRFSRPFTTDEIGATIRGDVIKKFTPISRSNIDALSQVQPTQLMVLGMAKNQVLPDVVNNTLTANYDLRYQRLLRKAVDLDGATSELGELDTDDLSYVRGIR